MMCATVFLQERIGDLFVYTNFTGVEVTWAVYQDIVTAYR